MRGMCADVNRRGPAAATWMFDAMRENRLIKPGDPIAPALPIFTP